jgi:hypothetical protein
MIDDGVELAKKIIEKTKDEKEFIEIKDLEKNSNKLDSGGIYIIKEKDRGIIYVGSASKQTLKDRLLNGHLKGKNTALTRKAPKLIGEKRYSKKEYAGLSKERKMEIGNLLKNNCLFFIQPIEDFDEVMAIEYLLILHFRKNVKELLNDYKE